MKKTLAVIFLFVVIGILFPKNINASSITCPNRYVTLVNPVRGRNLWSDKSLTPLLKQSEVAKKYNFPITWLLQYDSLIDLQVINRIKGFEGDEVGLFLEISKLLAEKAGVVYRDDLKWSNPGIVFLSAYSQSDRRALIDTLYTDYRENFGYYPKSIGAWWIDSYSLNYIKSKYGLDSIMIVADQKTTDSYGVWGQWWGYPYFPSKSNVLVPAGYSDSLKSTVIQWAQRDPELAYGEGASFSNFSLQANDYIRNGKDTAYFRKLSSVYLDCENSIGQVTIGMETGMEAVDFQGEYQNQLNYLSQVPDLKAVTMSEFNRKYVEVFKNNIPEIKIGNWNLKLSGRNDLKYMNNISFKDYFVADNGNFLDRNLAGLKPSTMGFSNLYLFLIVTLLYEILCVVKNRLNIFLPAVIFYTAAYGLIFRSGVFMGWNVFYGPVVDNILLLQLLIPMLIFIYFWFIPKKMNLFVWLLPLSFALDIMVSALRFSKINGAYFLGLLFNKTHLIGNGLNQDLPIEAVLSFAKFPFDKIWGNTILYIVINPLVHVVFACMIYSQVKRLNTKTKMFILIILGLFLSMYLEWIFNLDPRWAF